MDEIKAYVNRMFSELPKTKTVVEMRQNILESMHEHCDDLLLQGKSKNEALGAVISQFGNIDEIKKELGIKNNTDEPQQNGIIETIFAYFSPDVLFWRMLIHRSLSEAIIIFSAIAANLLLGFSLNLWSVSWIVLLLAGLVILLLNHRNSVKINYKAEVDSHYGILETIFAYFLPVVLFWRILIHRNMTEAIFFFSALAIHLLLGFALNLWSISWTAYLVAGFIILLYDRHEKFKKESLLPSLK